MHCSREVRSTVHAFSICFLSSVKVCEKQVSLYTKHFPANDSPSILNSVVEHSMHMRYDASKTKATTLFC